MCGPCRGTINETWPQPGDGDEGHNNSTEDSSGSFSNCRATAAAKLHLCHATGTVGPAQSSSISVIVLTINSPTRPFRPRPALHQLPSLHHFTPCRALMAVELCLRPAECGRNSGDGAITVDGHWCAAIRIIRVCTRPSSGRNLLEDVRSIAHERCDGEPSHGGGMVEHGASCWLGPHFLPNMHCNGSQMAHQA